MRAFELDGPGAAALRIVERPVPEPGPNEIVVRVRAASLNYRDLEIVQNRFNRRFAYPLVPLSDASGEIVAIGPAVRRFSVGNRVTTTFWQGWTGGSADLADAARQLGGAMQGVLADYITLDEEGAVRTPSHLTDEEASTLPCAAVTAWHALVTDGGVKAGDDVLIQGTGGVATFALQFAALSGARAIVLSGSDDKLERSRALGADVTINYRQHPQWSDLVLRETAGRGVDHVIDLGGASTLSQSVAALRLNGRINIIGYLGGEATVDAMAIFRKRARLSAISVGSRSSFETMNRAISFHSCHPVIDRVFAFEQFPSALGYLECGKHFGKIVIRLDP